MPPTLIIKWGPTHCQVRRREHWAGRARLICTASGPQVGCVRSAEGVSHRHWTEAGHVCHLGGEMTTMCPQIQSPGKPDLTEQLVGAGFWV